MTAAEKLEIVAQNRRQIFRIVDPEFADLRVLVKASEEDIEATCLDISATGIGLLVPQHFFEMATPGSIIEYSIFFGPLSPVKGNAIVASCIETGVFEGHGPLLRLGLRFTEAQDYAAGQRKVNGRRSERYFVPLALRPLCVCRDPLWLGDEVAIQVMDFSVHGLSGLVSAKKTVFAEGLRTVFRFGFDYLGLFEVPVRVIYANPTEDPMVFRIGCEFVRRPKDFVAAVETFFSLYLLDRRDGHKRGWPSSWFLPEGHVLSSLRQIEEAQESSAGQLNNVNSEVKAEDFSIYACLAHRQDETTDPFFRIDLATHDISGPKPDTEANKPVKQDSLPHRMTLPLDEIHTTGAKDLSKVISTFFYLAAAKRAEQVCLKHGNASSQVWSHDRFYKAGLRHLPPNLDGYTSYPVSELLSGKHLSFALWMSAFFPLSRFYAVLGPIISQLPFARRMILFTGYLLQRSRSASTAKKQVPSTDEQSRT